MEEPQTLNLRRVVKVRLPRGDGTTGMRESMNQDWIDSTKAIVDRLEGTQESLPMDLFKRLTMNALFESLQDKDSPTDVSLGVAQTFKMLIEEVFRIPKARIMVHSSQQKSSKNAPWACILFVLGTRKLGIFFQFKEPYCEIYIQPTGSVPEEKPLTTPRVQQNEFTSANPALASVLNKMTPRLSPPEQPVRHKISKFKEKFY